jgi:26S proteasome regulatory subunit N2
MKYIYEDVKNILYTNSTVTREDCRHKYGLAYGGIASEKASEMLAYAHDTQHEKIIRGLAFGIALTVYGKKKRLIHL